METPYMLRTFFGKVTFCCAVNMKKGHLFPLYKLVI